MNDEWGPWIEHDQNGCPESVINRFCEIEFWGVTRNLGAPYSKSGIITPPMSRALDWIVSHPADMRAVMIIRYRIRKPRGMVVLERLLADLPEREDA